MTGETLYESHSAGETRAIGRAIGEKAGPGEVYTLEGDLGVGKTVFTKGVAEGLGVKEPVTSPTFTIAQEYHSGRLPLYHFDVYRIGDPDEMEETGFWDDLEGGGVCLIEWPERIGDLLPEDRIRVTIEKDLSKGFDYRRIRITRPVLPEDKNL